MEKKIGIGEAIDLLWRFVHNQHLERRATLSGQLLSYKDSRTKIKSKKRKAKSTSNVSVVRKKVKRRNSYPNDGRAPGTNQLLVDIHQNFSGIPWSFINSDLVDITNTCRLDSVLTLLFILEQDRLKGGHTSILSNLETDHVLRQSFQYLKEGDPALAREVLGDRLADCDSTTDWLGDIHDCVRSVFGEIIGCMIWL